MFVLLYQGKMSVAYNYPSETNVGQKLFNLMENISSPAVTIVNAIWPILREDKVASLL